MATLVAYCVARHPDAAPPTTEYANANTTGTRADPRTGTTSTTSSRPHHGPADDTGAVEQAARVNISRDVTQNVRVLAEFWSHPMEHIVSLLMHESSARALASRIRQFTRTLPPEVNAMPYDVAIDQWFPRCVDNAYEAYDPSPGACSDPTDDWRSRDFRWFGQSTYQTFEPRECCVLTLLPKRTPYLVCRVYLYGATASGSRAGCAQRLQCLLVEHYDRATHTAYVLPPSNETTTVYLERRPSAPPDQWYVAGDDRKVHVAFQYLIGDRPEAAH